MDNGEKNGDFAFICMQSLCLGYRVGILILFLTTRATLALYRTEERYEI